MPQPLQTVSLVRLHGEIWKLLLGHTEQLAHTRSVVPVGAANSY